MIHRAPRCDSRDGAASESVTGSCMGRTRLFTHESWGPTGPQLYKTYNATLARERDLPGEVAVLLDQELRLVVHPDEDRVGVEPQVRPGGDVEAGELVAGRVRLHVRRTGRIGARNFRHRQVAQRIALRVGLERRADRKIGAARPDVLVALDVVNDEAHGPLAARSFPVVLVEGGEDRCRRI